MAVIKPVSFARGGFGYNDTSYLTKTRALKLIEELEAEKAAIDARITKLREVEGVAAKKK